MNTRDKRYAGSRIAVPLRDERRRQSAARCVEASARVTLNIRSEGGPNEAITERPEPLDRPTTDEEPAIV
jgi:hypothetical protein